MRKCAPKSSASLSVCLRFIICALVTDARLSFLSSAHPPPPTIIMSYPDFVRFKNYSTADKVIKLMIEYGAITEEVKCKRCQAVCGINNRKRSADGNQKAVYRCTKAGCSWRESVLKGSVFEGTKLSLSQVWHIIVIYTLNLENTVGELLDISVQAVSGYRQKINRKVKELLAEEEHAMIGGKGTVVQGDETMVISGAKSSHLDQLSACPSHLPDDYPGAIWVIGAVVQGEGNTPLWAEVVPNRQAKTMIEVFRRHVRPETFLITDGHACYPLVAKALNYEHHVVVHKEGVICKETGTNTQKIESFWAFLKHSLDKQWGTDRAHADLFVNEVVFNKRFLKDDPVGGLRMLLKKLFEK